ncbi:hypothetical protein [Rhizobium mayense]|uniref:Uncharacterized protein n=1 Tax=Rhizobium mayense TaxID=1312184 RepID=A0ABT7K5T1_9HYPH|nr:hypothetical protein [Rhizobium mayense]MDL2403979.1 hypothetical protein [Rhizobium mayense]
MERNVENSTPSVLDKFIQSAKLSDSELARLQQQFDELEHEAMQEQHHEHHDESVPEPEKPKVR